MRFFAACLPGLEPLLSDEIAGLVTATPKVVPGGVEVEGDEDVLYRLALGSGLASHLTLRVATFNARRFEALVRETAKLPWKRLMGEAARFEVRARCRKSKLHHSGAVEERVVKAIVGARGEGGGDDPPFRIGCRLFRDEVTLSMDLTGEPLFKRGYRQATAKAPLREDLARALLSLSGWDRAMPLLDPFCGSGTIAIEAARMALGLLPGGQRAFDFERAAFYDRGRFEAAKGALAARLEEGRVEPQIRAADRDAGAVKSATENAARAGVADVITFENAALGKASFFVDPPTVPSLVATNPPHGRRVGDPKTLRRLYQSLGTRIEALPDGSLVALLVRDARMARAVGVPLESRLTTDQGGGKVQVLVGHKDA